MRPKIYPDNDFITRLRLAFDNALDVDIARRIGSPQGTVGRWVKEGVLPASTLLIRIREVTGVSLDWLLTGEGPKWKTNRTASDDGPLRLLDELDEQERELLNAQARRNKRTANAEAVAVLRMSLRAARLLRKGGNLNDLPPEARLALLAEQLKGLVFPE